MLRRSIPASLIFLLLSLSVFAAPKKKDSDKAKTPSLASQIDTVMAEPDVARGFWGVDIESLDSGRTLYSLNADRLFTPASNTKLFTTATALALIGPDYRFQTTVETSGALDKYGRLSGDLVLVGRGDPNLSGRVLPYNIKTERTTPPTEVLEELADQLVQKGLKFVDGDVIGDDSYYAFERYGEGWSQDDLVTQWAAPASALTINDNVIFVNVLPGDHVGDKAFVDISPFADYYRLDNRIMTTPPGTGPRNLHITREPGSMHLTIWGTMPLDDIGFSDALAIDDPAEFAAHLFRNILEKRGIVVYGASRTHHTELANLSTVSITVSSPSSGGGNDIPTRPALPQRLVLASYQSQPLMQDLRVINKVSQNLHAELLLRLLGREKGSSGTIESGLEVVHGFVTMAGITGDEYVFFDGSGMSRQNLVTPHAIVKLLTYATHQPWGAQYQDTFPVAGVDGSLADRLKGTPAQGKVLGKTGTLAHVNAMSGYATTSSGEHVVYSIMANNHSLTNRRAQDVIDQIVAALVATPATAKKK